MAARPGPPKAKARPARARVGCLPVRGSPPRVRARKTHRRPVSGRDRVVTAAPQAPCAGHPHLWHRQHSLMRAGTALGTAHRQSPQGDRARRKRGTGLPAN